MGLSPCKFKTLHLLKVERTHCSCEFMPFVLKASCLFEIAINLAEDEIQIRVIKVVALALLFKKIFQINVA